MPYIFSRLFIGTMIALFVHALFVMPSYAAAQGVWKLSPSPTTQSIGAVYVVADNDAWMVGDGGTLLRWNGSAWQTATSSTTQMLWAVDGVSSDIVWAVGDGGTVLRRVVGNWESVTSPTSENLLGVEVLSSSNVWVVGDGGSIYQWNGSSWQNYTQSDFSQEIFYDVDFSEANNGWVVGTNGTVLRWNGGSWSPVASGTTATLFSVVTRATNDVWMVGENGTVRRWNGSSIAAEESSTSESLLDIVMQSATEGWAVGNNGVMISTVNGTTWATEETLTNVALFGVGFAGEGSPAGEGFAVGANGTTLSFTPNPGTPTSATPQGIGAGTTPTFTWSAAAYAERYTIAIDTSNQFLNPTIVGDLVTLSYTPTDPLADGNYFWRVRAENIVGSGNWSATRSFTIDTTVPSAPDLVSPNADVLLAAPPTFTWNGSTDANTPLTYTVEIDGDASFTAPIAKTITTNATTATPETLSDGVYFWRVRVSDPAGNENVSTVRSFILDATAPPAPTILEPANGASVETAKPTFAWSAGEDVAEFDIAIYPTGEEPPVTPITVLTTTYTPSSSLAFTAYTWRVRVRDHAGNVSLWSTATVTLTDPGNSSGGGGSIPTPAPGIFALTAPTGSNSNARPEFSWAASENADRYDLIIAGDGHTFAKEISGIAATTYTPSEALPEGRYTARMIARNAGEETASAGPFSFVIDITAPPVPELDRAAYTSTKGIEFYWHPVIDAFSGVTYQIELDEGKTVKASNLAQAYYLFSKESVQSGTRYFWRVFAVDAAGNRSAGSSTQSITAATSIIILPVIPPIGAFSLVSPTDTATVTTTRPQFSWGAASEATAYELTITGVTASSFVKKIGPLTVTNVPLGVADELSNGNYTWFVRAFNDNVERFSETWRFTVAVPSTPAPTLPTLEVETPTPVLTSVGTTTPTVSPAGEPTLTLETITRFGTDRPLFIGSTDTPSRALDLLIDGQRIVAVTTDAHGEFSVQSPIPLTDGTHALTLVMGGVSSNVVTITVNTRAPEAPRVDAIRVVRQTPSSDGTVDTLLIISATLGETTRDVTLLDPATEKVFVRTPAPSDGLLTITLPQHAVAVGTHTLLLTARDREAHAATTSVTYTITAAPILYACADGTDNDRDMRQDYPSDPGCVDYTDTDENDTFSVLVSAVTDAMNDTGAATREATRVVVRETVNQTVAVAEVTERVVQAATPIARPALAVAAPAAIALNPIAASQLPALPGMATHAFSWLFSALGIRKKRKNPWGVVYDAITKDPIGLAIIRLLDAGTKRILATQVTDKDGRFEFLVKPGTYCLEVVKSPYHFPSAIVKGGNDGERVGVYHGETVTITTEGQSMQVAIPIDPEDPKARVGAGFRQFIDRARRLVSVASLPLLVFGTAMSIVIYAFIRTQYNLLVLLIYIAFAAYHIVILPKTYRSFGTIFDAATLAPVPLALVHIVDPQFQRVLKSRLSDYQGRFTFLPDPGTYELRVAKQGYVFPSATPITQSKYRDPYKGGVIVVEKKRPIIASNVPIDPRPTPPPADLGGQAAPTIPSQT